MAKLLGTDELKDTPDCKHVSKREKAKQLYDIVFVRKQDSDYYRGIAIGRTIFRYGIRQRIMSA